MKCGFSLTALLLCCLSSALAQDCGDEGITVTIDIKLLGSSEDTISGNINGPLSLECAVELDVPGTVSDTKPDITSVVWTKNDEILLDEFTGMMLQISSLQSSDGGVYRCSAVTSLPCTTVQSDATAVNTAPTVSLSPSSNIFAVVGDSVEITCQVEGWPTPSLTWTSNTAIDISPNPVLVIDAATTADSGQYSCTADNGETDEDAILTQTITITITTENTGPVTTPVTSAPTDGTTTTSAAPTDGTTTTSAAPTDGTTTTSAAPTDGTTTTSAAPTDGTTTTSAAPTDGTTTTNAAESVNSNSLGGPVIRPTENGFYIAIAVTAFVCLLLTVITIFAVSIWCYKKHKSERKAEYQEEEYQEAEYQEEESNTDLQTVETSLM